VLAVQGTFILPIINYKLKALISCITFLWTYEMAIQCSLKATNSITFNESCHLTIKAAINGS
jgi:hypothetical protein